MNNILSNFIDETCKSLENLRKNDVIREFEYDFKCKDLEDYLNFDITNSNQFKQLFINLKEIKGPVLYWYEIISEHTNDEIINALKVYSQTNQRATPVFYQNYSRDTRVLYVGKCKESFWGRVIQHLGYYKTHTTQGLQLYHWAKDLCLDVRLHALEFDTDMKEIMPIVESFFAKSLTPLVGKHI